MTKPKPMLEADTRVYTQGALRAVVQDSGHIKSWESNYRVRCTIQQQLPDGTWRA